MDIKESEKIDPEFLEDFISETIEYIEEIEMQVLNLEKNPSDKELINAIFRAFHTIKGLAGFVNLNTVQKISHQTESIMDMCRKGKIDGSKEVIRLILVSVDYIKQICENVNVCDDDLFIKSVSDHLGNLKQYQENIGGENNNGTGIQNLNKEKNRLNETVKNSVNASTGNDYLRVHADKVDNLVDMMGELIISQSVLEQEAANRFGRNDIMLNKIMQISRITRGIQKLSMSLRMVSLKSLFRKISRITRDTILELNKSVTLETSGEETEIDRNIADKLLEPLLHLVKNSISHGIEDEKTRRKLKKHVEGKVTINAYSKKGNVYIEVIDDGGGIDTKKVYKKALAKNLIDSLKTYSDNEINEFIFLPGFSTSENVDNISGRGVGMDVVKTEVSRIGGKVEVVSIPGKGCKFTLKIPINLAIMNGTVVRIKNSNYIIPTLNVKQIIQPEKNQLVQIKGRHKTMYIRNEIISVFDIYEAFGFEKDKNYGAIILILELDQKQLGIPVENVIGRQEIVVKPLGSEFMHINYFSGASLLGDGKVSLILDIENIFKLEGGKK